MKLFASSSFPFPEVLVKPEVVVVVVASVEVVAVSGGLKCWGWRTDENGLCNINNTRDFRSAISRNRDIRRFVEKSVAHELKLFGVKSWEISIGRLNIKESI